MLFRLLHFFIVEIKSVLRSLGRSDVHWGDLTCNKCVIILEFLDKYVCSSKPLCGIPGLVHAGRLVAQNIFQFAVYKDLLRVQVAFTF